MKKIKIKLKKIIKMNKMKKIKIQLLLKEQIEQMKIL